MDLTSIKIVKDLLKNHDTKPSKTMGQNFLVNRQSLEKVVKAANLSRDDVVLEIGPGIGNLTKELSRAVKRVVAVEKDRKMIEILKDSLKDTTNVEIIYGDALKFNLDNKLENGYKVVANIPYYLTSALIRKLLESKVKPSLIVLMVQKEIAKRICEKPPRMSLLSLSVQFYAKPEIISYIPKGNFWPSPKVDSAIIKIFEIELKDEKLAEDFFKLAKAGFAHPRKQLQNNLSKALGKNKEEIGSWLLKNNIKPSQRPETLEVKDWINLVNSL